MTDHRLARVSESWVHVQYGKEASMVRGASRQLAHLWQFPLLILSLLVFAAAGYLYTQPMPGLTVGGRIDSARALLRAERPDAALEQLNRLITGERIASEDEASVHLLMGEALELGQRQRKVNIPA